MDRRISTVIFSLSFLFIVNIVLCQENGSHPCKRKCDGNVMTCKYEFHIERYTTMGPACRNCSTNPKDCTRPQCIPADGTERWMLAINRQFPGPPIEVCKGDRIVVDVENALEDIELTMHWHGIRQTETPWMDGAPMVTQCPIVGGQTFRYDFKVDVPGTYFYHSHSGLSKLEGLQGPLIVRQQNDPDANLYDDELIMFMTDWKHSPVFQVYPGVQKVPDFPDNYLFNGQGVKKQTKDFPTSGDLKKSTVPPARFKVQSGKRYRLRLIAALGFACPIELSIQDHSMTVITTDGGNRVEPVTVSSIGFGSAERFDVIIKANRKVGSYWISLKGLGFPPCTGTNNYAVLEYKNTKAKFPSKEYKAFPSKKNSKLNYPNRFCNSTNDPFLCIHELKTRNQNDVYFDDNSKNCSATPYTFGFYFYSVDDLFAPGSKRKYYDPQDPHLLWRPIINNMSYTLTPSPLLTQFDDIPKSSFCNETCLNGANPRDCSCSLVSKHQLNSIVTLLLLDGDPYDVDHLAHTLHLHGFDFTVMEQGVLGDNLQRDTPAILQRISPCADGNKFGPLKDTVIVPSAGYTVIRFKADNPGFWIFHCHILMHNVLGMATVFQVGERSEMKPIPTGFPTCGNYKPDNR